MVPLKLSMVSMVLKTAMPPPPTHILQWLSVNSMFPDRVIFVLSTASAVPKLSWKKLSTTSASFIDSNCSAYLLAGERKESLPQKVNPREWILKSTILVKRRPTDPLQTTVALLPEEDSPRMVSLATLATVMFISRVWSPGKNTIVVLDVKYSSASRAYSESVVQLVELWGQDEHEVAVGVTQYTFSAEQ